MNPAFFSKKEEYYSAIRDSILVQHSITTTAHDAPFHFHDDYEIYLFLSGDVDFHTEMAVHHLQRGHLLVCNDQELHRACYFGKYPYERFAIHFNYHLVEGLCTARTNLLGCFRNHKPGFGNAALLSEEQISTIVSLGEKLQALSDSDSFGSDVLTLSYLSELLVFVNAIFLETQPARTLPHHGLVFEVMEYIDSHLTADLSLEGIAQHFAVDKYHLSHLFCKQTGNALYHYVLIKKVASAKLYLSQGKTVTETCALAGFHDYNNFIRTFKKLTGISPGKYGKTI